MENNLPNMEEIKVFLLNNNYQFQRFLGKGDYSVVVQAYSNEDEVDVAVKIFNEEDQDIEKEIQILEKLQGEQHFVQIISTIIDPNMNLYAVVTELYDCDLGKAHQMKDPLIEHTNSSLAGNLIYMSPEVSNGAKPYTIKADVFSIGVIILQCLLGAQLKPEQIIFLKTSLLINVIPDIQAHPNYDFIEKILSYMVNFDKNERLEPLRLIQKLKSMQKIDVSCLNKLVLPKKQESSQPKLKKSVSQVKQTSSTDQKQTNIQNLQYTQYQQVQQQPVFYKSYSQQNFNLSNLLPQNGNQKIFYKIKKITAITPIYYNFDQQNQFYNQMYQMPTMPNTPQGKQYSKPPQRKNPNNYQDD